MSQMMDASADPCQDFYQYACGGWIAEGLPEDHAKWTIFAYLAEQTENKLRDLIESQKDAGITVDRVQGSLVLTILWLGITRLRWILFFIFFSVVRGRKFATTTQTQFAELRLKLFSTEITSSRVRAVGPKNLSAWNADCCIA